MTKGMAFRNAALRQLSTKSKKKRSSLYLQKLKVKKLLLGLPNVLKKNSSIPHVHYAIPYPSHSKRHRLSKWRNKRIVTSVTARDRDAKQLCAVMREERAEELARASMANNAARKRRAMAVLKSALTMQRDNGGEKNISRHMSGIGVQHSIEYCELS